MPAQLYECVKFSCFLLFRFQKPVRAILDRQTDMMISGKRGSYEVHYSIAFTSEGKIKGLECKLYCDGGCSLDASPAVN
jgi:xanthine dehydrogenase/oxidase